jgi:16S rRNA (guanine(527)-N(7))-methyltransferase RsmG
VRALCRLALLLSAWSQRINLSGHREPDEIVRRLILDAAALDAAIPEDLESIADIGSGAGFPGLPMAILHPARRVTLIESRERRHHFQRLAIRELQLRNADARLGRAEALEAQPHAAAIAQATARPDAALRLLLPWVRPGGLLLIPGAARASVVAPDLLVEPLPLVHYDVPLGGPQRTLWMGRKAGDPRDGRSPFACDT